MQIFTPFDRLVASEAAVRGTRILKVDGIPNEGIRGGLLIDPLVDHARGLSPDAGNTPEEVGQNLFDNFIKIFRFLYQDSSQHYATMQQTTFNSRRLSEKDLEDLRSIFKKFARNWYDKNGKVNMNEHHAKRAIINLYEEVAGGVMRNRPGGTALGVLLVEMSRGKKWRDAKLGPDDGLNFTRGEPTPNLEQRVDQAFASQNHKPQPGEFVHHTESVEVIAGMTFPVKKNVSGYRKHLITHTGHLIDLTDELRAQLTAHLESGKPLEEFTLPLGDAPHISQFQETLADYKARHTQEIEKHYKAGAERNQALAELDEACEARGRVLQRLQDMENVWLLDGKPVDRKHVQLVSMDIDLLTGLRMTPGKEGGASELTRFMAFLKDNGVAKLSDLVTDDMMLQNPPGGKRGLTWADRMGDAIAEKLDTMKSNAPKDVEGLIESVKLHLRHSIPYAYEHSEKAFFDDAEMTKKKPTAAENGQSQPRLYMTQGGPCIGKSGLKKIARNECGSSLVTASLDEAREGSDRYWLYPALNNHNDDYAAIGQFGNMVRDLVTRRAHQGGYNVLIDGSGIPYIGKNAMLVHEFKERNYHVSVMGAHAPLIDTSSNGHGDKIPDDAFARLGKRLNMGLRAVPICNVMVDKHIRSAIASRNAARDDDVDRFLIQDMSGLHGKEYTLSYVVRLTPAELEKIAALTGEALHDAIVADPQRLKPHWVTLPENNTKHYDLKVVRHNSDDSFLVEIITDIEQYISMVQKGLYYADAQGKESLAHNTLAFDMNGYFHGANGTIHLQPGKNTHEVGWSQYDPLSQRIHAAAPNHTARLGGEKDNTGQYIG